MELFNRCYAMYDPKNEEDLTYLDHRFVSEWIPGDYVGGSGGPPMVTVMGDSDEPEEADEEEVDEEEE